MSQGFRLVHFEKSYRAEASLFIYTLPHGILRATEQCVPSLAVPAIRHCLKHLQHPGTAWKNAPWGHCPFSQGAKLRIVWTTETQC